MFAYTKIMQALAAAGVVPAATDPYFNLTTLLLNTSSTNGAQNNTFLDSSTNNFTITRNGNTTQGTFTPFSQTGWGNYFNGSTDYLSVASTNAVLPTGTQDYCVETWMYWGSPSGTVPQIVSNPTNNGFQLYYDVGTSVLAIGKYNIGNITTYSIAQSALANQWTHVVATRSGNTHRLFVNGVLRANVVDTFSFAALTTQIIGGSATAQGYFSGYLSNLRTTLGSIPTSYQTSSTTNGTSVFTPPTSPLTTTSQGASSPALLTCQSNRFVDNSANAFAISTGGTPSVQAFSPFAPTAAYDTAVVGGSGYFDGTGDYLSAASNAAFAFGTGDFTVEFWFYPSVSSQDNFDKYFETGTSVGNLVIDQQSTANQFTVNDNNTILVSSSSNLTPYAWNHVAVARSGTTLKLFLNGAQVGSVTNSTNFTQAGAFIGANNSGTQNVTGYFSSFRILKGTAQYTSAFTPPTAPLTAITNTSLLLSCTNTGIYDSASKNVLETVGNAQVSTTQAKWGTTSMYFDGTGDYLKAPYTPNMDFGTGDFTIECWVYVTNTSPGYNQAVLARQGNSGGVIWLIQILNGGTSRIVLGGSVDCNGTTVAANTWTHIAFTRSGTSLRAFNNGVLISTVTGSTNLSGTQILSVGGQSAGEDPFIGYIDDVRITKGFARYTATFTPPTAAFPLQ